jgi:hypothetical protein
MAKLAGARSPLQPAGPHGWVSRRPPSSGRTISARSGSVDFRHQFVHPIVRRAARSGAKMTVWTRPGFFPVRSKGEPEGPTRRALIVRRRMQLCVCVVSSFTVR